MDPILTPQQPSHERLLDLRAIFGIDARITVSAASNGGELVAMECTAFPGAATTVHYHAGQEEHYEVLDGTLEVLRGGEWVSIHSGESMVVPPGAVHAFRNAGATPVRFRNVHRPALGFQDHLETVDRLVREGKVRGTSDLRSMAHLCMSAVRHRPDVAVKPPQWLVETLARIGRSMGYTID